MGSCVPSPELQNYCNSDLRLTLLGCLGGSFEVQEACGPRQVECEPADCPPNSVCSQETARCEPEPTCNQDLCPEWFVCDASGQCVCQPETDEELCRELAGTACGTIETEDRCESSRTISCNSCQDGKLCVEGVCQQRCEEERGERCGAGFVCTTKDDQSYCAPDSCTCKDPSDRCTVERDGCFLGGARCPIKQLTCQRTDQQCNPVTPCPEGYTCQGSTCVCTAASCGASCTVQADCPDGTTCEADGSCKPRPPIGCARDAQCDVMAGERCDSIRFENGFFCAVPGSKQPGQSCNYSIECAYPSCESNICLAPCAKQGDCPMGLTCSPHKNYFTNRNRLSCRVEPACANCQTNQVCVQGRCEDRLCQFNKDCPDNGSQVCMWLEGSVGVCRAFTDLPARAASCTRDEDYLDTYIDPMGQYYFNCISDRRCTADGQCNAGERCRSYEKARFCGRSL